MPSVTSNRPWMAVSWLCRHRLGLTVSGQSPVQSPGEDVGVVHHPAVRRRDHPGLQTAIRPRFAFSKSVRSVVIGWHRCSFAEVVSKR